MSKRDATIKWKFDIIFLLPCVPCVPCFLIIYLLENIHIFPYLFKVNSTGTKISKDRLHGKMHRIIVLAGAESLVGILSGLWMAIINDFLGR